MSKWLYAIVTALAMVTSHADGQTNGEKFDSNAIANTSPSTADFVKFAAIGAMLEIEASRLATERADLASKKFAATIIEEHTKILAEIKALGFTAGVDVPVSLDASYQGKLDKLKGLQLGGDFDAAYDRMQVEVLKEAVALFERYAKGGANKALKEFAEQTLPELQRNLLLASDLRK